MKAGLSISEIMDNHRYAFNDVPVEYEGISYIASNVRRDGLVELYLGLQSDQPDMIVSTDLVYIKE